MRGEATFPCIELTRRIFGAAIEVHDTFGPGLFENAYRADLIVGDAVIVELKAVERFLPIHDAQLLTYLKLCGCEVGLLINFNVASLRKGIRRLVLSRAR